MLASSKRIRALLRPAALWAPAALSGSDRRAAEQAQRYVRAHDTRGGHESFEYTTALMGLVHGSLRL